MLTFENNITPDTPLESLPVVFDEAYRAGAEVIRRQEPNCCEAETRDILLISYVLQLTYKRN